MSHESGVTGLDVARTIGPRLAEAAVAYRLGDRIFDLATPITDNGDFSVVTLADDDGLYILRHSTAHVLAQAVLSTFPGSTFAIGPPIEDGFYYDFGVDTPFTPDDLQHLEDRMREIVAEDQPFERVVMSSDEALRVFADHRFKLEIIESVDPAQGAEGDTVSAYRNNSFIDLCRGPHIPSTGRIPAFKLLRTSGAYWRGDETREQLQRIYGTAWPSASQLEEHLIRLEEAERRDHRRLGPELDLFSFPNELGSGLAVWHARGGLLRKMVEDRSRILHERYGFDFVFTPHLMKADLWRTSGHLEYYEENMYPRMEMDNGVEYQVKPMNCPGHILVYQSRSRSYRELPMRLSELGGVYRYEKSGVVHGLLRARGFTQDDSHTFCTEEQLADELRHHLRFVVEWHTGFGFDEADIEAELSTQPEKSVGEQTRWEISERLLAEALDAEGVQYRVAPGEGAFYGPKIDIHIKDAIGRRWQMGTVQLDFNEPERFDLEYTASGNVAERPYMIHCAKAGSIERFIGILVEHYGGAFPMWLAPVQVSVVPVADRHHGYGREVVEALAAGGLRAELDDSDQSVGEKIRRALTQKHPAVLVVGDDDVANQTVGLRMYGEEKDRRGLALGDAVALLVGEAAGPA